MPPTLRYTPMDVHLIHAHFAEASSVRSNLAATTILVRAGRTSPYFLVFKPQSGLTHRMFVSSTASILRIRSAISSVSGMRGECMS
eukprot:Gb_23739 [translate_table: standard]